MITLHDHGLDYSVNAPNGFVTADGYSNTGMEPGAKIVNGVC